VRLFFALWPDGDTRKAINGLARPAVRRAGGRPVPATHFHMTLAFLGQVPEALFEDIVAAGNRAALEWPARGIALELDRFGYWPKPRVFWLGASDTPRALTALAERLWDALGRLDIARDPKPLVPHVTLCRKVQRAPGLANPRPVHWHAAGFALVESVTAQAGAEYTVVARFPGESSGGSSHDP
jgi:2'-5' RNA ligase